MFPDLPGPPHVFRRRDPHRIRSLETLQELPDHRLHYKIIHTWGRCCVATCSNQSFGKVPFAMLQGGGPGQWQIIEKTIEPYAPK